MKKFFKEFKEFISRGNVVDLAVAVIIGGAFSAIVTALTNQIIMPLVNWVLSLIVGKDGLAGAVTMLSPVYQTDELGQFILDANGNKIVELSKSIYIDWGAFISAIINFIIIAFTIFCLVKVINASRQSFERLSKDLMKQASKEARAHRKEIRAIAKEQGISYKKAKLQWQEKEEARLAEEKAKLEEQQKAEEKPAEANSTEKLLSEIRDLLAVNTGNSIDKK
ncbi:MAG: MscL family protein [Clostridia bacterium]|nr:MscL family protein [Clostridia bacterium]